MRITSDETSSLRAAVPSRRRRAIGTLLLAAAFFLEAGGTAEALLADRYGGLEVRVANPTGFFRVGRFGNRWLLVTPEGNAFWMLAVYVVGRSDYGSPNEPKLAAKYNRTDSLGFEFAAQAVRRLRAWGFNTIGEYSENYAYPVPTVGRQEANTVQMPFIRLLRPSYYGLLNQWKLAPGPFKDIVIGTDAIIYNGWRGSTFPDVFDPNFALYAKGMAGELYAVEQRGPTFTRNSSRGGLPHPSLAREPWLVGTTMDDADDLYGFGPGTEVPAWNGVVHSHLGWLAAVTAPTQSENRRLKMKYSDPTVYTKRVWRDFIKRKYGLLSRLNAAWGSSYTSWDSSGGWPNGKGVLDESGKNKWMGRDFDALSDANPQTAKDLDEFLGVIADKYFETLSTVIRRATPSHLVFGPAMLNGHKGLSRAPILRAAGQYCDVVQVNQDPYRPELIGMTYQRTQKPMYTWMGFKANPDSGMYAHSSTNSVNSQAERAALYKREVEMLFSTRSSDGVNPMVGLDWWEFADKWGEKANWGLVSSRDNAYDGREAVIARRTDPWGYPSGGEDRNYGDFLTTVKGTNSELLNRIMMGLRGPRSSPIRKE